MPKDSQTQLVLGFGPSWRRGPILALSALLLLPAAAQCQRAPASPPDAGPSEGHGDQARTDTLRVGSSILAQEREIFVSLPDSWERTSRS